MNIIQILGKNLSDSWQLRIGYCLELKHGLMGCFPMIEEKSKKIAICWTKDDLKKIWKKLPRRESKITKFLFLVCENEKKVFILEKDYNQDYLESDEFFFVFDNVLQEYLKGKISFRWAPGLLSFENESNAMFPDE